MRPMLPAYYQLSVFLFLVEDSGPSCAQHTKRTHAYCTHIHSVIRVLHVNTMMSIHEGSAVDTLIQEGRITKLLIKRKKSYFGILGVKLC